MEIKCQKCGEVASDDQAFCSKCGAVLGMGDAGRAHDEAKPNLAATMVGKFPFAPPPSNPAPTPPPQPPPQSRGAQAPAAPPPARQAPLPQPPRQQQASPPSLDARPPARGGGVWLLVIIGFVAVLLVGALLIYLFFFNLRQ